MGNGMAFSGLGESQQKGSQLAQVLCKRLESCGTVGLRQGALLRWEGDDVTKHDVRA